MRDISWALLTIERGASRKSSGGRRIFLQAHSTRNRLFGKWAASGLGLSGSEAEEYAKSVVFADLQEPGDDDIIAKVEQDLRAKSIIMTRAQLRKKLDEFAVEANTR